MDPFESGPLYANLEESSDEGVVGDSVEGHGEVEQDEGHCFSSVEDVINAVGGCNECCFGAVVLYES